MSLIDTHKKLSATQLRFVCWLEEKMPQLLKLFNFNEPGYKPGVVEEYFSLASHGEVILARFVLGVWRHDDEFNFDFIDAARTLDEKNMSIIIDWLENPFWP